MTTIAPRIAQLTVGLPGGVGFTWGTIPDGSAPLYWEAEIEKTAAKVPSKVKVEIYNLSKQSIAFCEMPGSVVQVVAGEGTPAQLCYADIPKHGVHTEAKQPDLVTTIKGAEGQRIYREATFSGTYPAGTTRSQIMVELIAQARCTRGFIDPAIPERVYPSGTCWLGTVRSVLDQLWSPDGAVWWLDGQRLMVLGPLTISVPGGNAPLVSVDTGMSGSPTRTDKGGVTVTTKLLPGIGPGQPFAIQSRFASGNYRATKVAHKLSSDGKVWETKLTGVPWK